MISREMADIYSASKSQDRTADACRCQGSKVQGEYLATSQLRSSVHLSVKSPHSPTFLSESYANSGST
jgi:hypothetical protein